jgi:Uma2 family endonuclease
MSALPEETTTMSETEYLAFERTSDIKHQYVDGDVFAMTGASREHNLICHNLSRIIGNDLLERPCEVYQSDMRVKVEATRLYTYPDVTVVCDEPQLSDQEFDTLLNPLILIEVLSPSTERFDRGRKFQDYREIGSLREYLLVSQDEARIEQYIRQENGEWLFKDVVGLEGELELPSVGCRLAMGDVYRKVTFEEE